MQHHVPVETCAFNFGEGKKSRIYQADYKLAFKILDVRKRLLTEKVFSTELVLRSSSDTNSSPC